MTVAHENFRPPLYLSAEGETAQLMDTADQKLAWSGRLLTDEYSPRVMYQEALNASSSLFTGYGIGRIPEIILLVMDAPESIQEIAVRVQPKLTQRRRIRIRSVSRGRAQPASDDFTDPGR